MLCTVAVTQLLSIPSYPFCLRGDDFRIAFAHLGELRSVLPSSVKVLALTATATEETFKANVDRLSLKDPTIVALPPERPNIFYSVHEMVSMDSFSSNIARDIKQKKTDYPETVIFCWQYLDCTNMYLISLNKLGSDITDPPGFPNLQQFRIVDIFTRASTVEMKEKILSSFCLVNSKLRILIATTAFGMGIDCLDIRINSTLGPTS